MQINLGLGLGKSISGKNKHFNGMLDLLSAKQLQCLPPNSYAFLLAFF